MKSFDYDLRYLKAGVEDLEGYLLSEHLFWPLEVKTYPKEPAYPNLTLGNLLLSKERLVAYDRTLEQEGQLGAVLQQLGLVRSKWRAAWSKKASRSLENRLGMWRDFLADYLKGPESNANRYAYEVQRRVMVELLRVEVDEVPSQVTRLLAKLDDLLETFLLPGEFIWEAEVEGGFPKPGYWYLYGRLPERLEAAELDSDRYADLLG